MIFFENGVIKVVKEGFIQVRVADMTMPKPRVQNINTVEED